MGAIYFKLNHSETCQNFSFRHPFRTCLVKCNIILCRYIILIFAGIICNSYTMNPISSKLGMIRF